MKRITGALPLLVLALLSAGCKFKIFEDIGTDPHPPSIEIVSIGNFKPAPAPAPTPKAAADASRKNNSVTWDTGGFTVVPGQLFQLTVNYHDAGGDIVSFKFRDRDGGPLPETAPTEQVYFPGLSGTLLVPADGAELKGNPGPHRLLLWAEDSHESRSEMVEFVVTLAL